MISAVPRCPVLAAGRLRVRRLLPYPAEILVGKGQRVGPDDVLARATTPGEPLVVPLAAILRVRPYEVIGRLRKQPGEAFRPGEVLAQAGLVFRRTYVAPFAGTLTRVLPDRGAIVLAPAADQVILHAHIAGTVVQVVDGRGVELEVAGLLCHSLVGFGPEAHGPLRVQTGPDSPLAPEHCGAACRGTIVVGGYLAPGTRAAAAASGVAGLVVGSVPGEALGELSTGIEGPAIVVLHWLGRQGLVPDIHALLARLEGQTASVLHCAAALPRAVSAPVLAIAGDVPRPSAAPVGAIVTGAHRGALLETISPEPQAVATFGPLRGAVARVRLRDAGEHCLPAWAVEDWTPSSAS